MLLRPRAVPFLSVLVLSLLVAGCGGSDGDAGDGARDASPAATAPVDPSAAAQQRSSELRASVKEWVNAIESCAAVNTDGSYTGCLDTATLVEGESSLAATEPVVTVEPADDPRMSYVVTIEDDMQFTERHGSDGSIQKTCTPVGAPGCEDGTW